MPYLFSFYCVLPILIYGPFIFVAEPINISFYGVTEATNEQFLKILLAHLFFGFLFLKLVDADDLEFAISQRKPSNSVLDLLFLIFTAAYLSGFHSYISLVSLCISIILISNFRIATCPWH